MTTKDSVVGDWTREIALAITRDLQVDDYQFDAKPGLGPVVFVVVKGAAEDATTARETRARLAAIVDPLIKRGLLGVEGFSVRVRSFNRGDDLLLECEVIFPDRPGRS